MPSPHGAEGRLYGKRPQEFYPNKNFGRHRRILFKRKPLNFVNQQNGYHSPTRMGVKLIFFGVLATASSQQLCKESVRGGPQVRKTKRGDWRKMRLRRVLP